MKQLMNSKKIHCTETMENCMKCFALCVVTCVGLLTSLAAWSAGLTGEDESLLEYRSGRLPAVLSKDGEWLVYVDGDSILHRRNISTGTDQKAMLFRSPKLIGSSNNAEKIVVRNDNCISIVDFSNFSPSIRHLKSTCETISGADLNYAPGDRFYGSLGLAISGDTKLVAFDEVTTSDQRKIVLLDSTSNQVVSQIPVIGSTLHIQFLDQHSKLLVVQGIFGEKWEALAEPSSLQFFVWDLKTRNLQAFFESALITITGETLLWHFSEATGDLFAVGQTADPFNRDVNTPVPILKFNLKQCSSSPSSLKVGMQYISDFTADPLVRWIATVEGQKLIVRKSSNGDVLLEKNLENLTRSFIPSLDGKTLFGVESGTLESQRQGEFGGQVFGGGGKVIDIPLAQYLEDIPLQENAAWPTDACRIEDEAISARQLSAGATPIKLYEINLGELDLAIAMPDQANCYSGVNYEHGAVFNKWGLSEDNRLWIDAYDHLEEFELLTQKSISRLPVTRSADQCNLSIFSQRVFLSWKNDGDTVTVVPFDKSGAEKIFVQRTGQTLSNITQRGSGVGIAWANFEEDANAKHPVIYDLKTGMEIVTLPDAYTELATPDFVYTPPIEDMKPGSYQWLISYGGSVRAYFRSIGDQKVSTVLWDGLSYPQKFDVRLNESRLEDRELIDLGFGWAAIRQQSGVTLYNAATKKRYAEIPLQNPGNLAWSDKDRVLLVETTFSLDENGKNKWILHAYKVD